MVKITGWLKGGVPLYMTPFTNHLYIYIPSLYYLLYCAVPENIYTHPEEDHWEFQRVGGEGCLKIQNYRRQYETKVEFPEGWGLNQ